MLFNFIKNKFVSIPYYSALSGLCLALSSLALTSNKLVLPELIGTTLAGLGVALLIISSREESDRPAKAGLFFGITFHFVAFYWLIYTLENFSGFPLAIVIVLYLFFCFISSLQFIFYYYLVKNCLNLFDRINWLKISTYSGISYICSDICFFQIFPWNISHTFLAITPLAVLGSFFGVLSLSLIIFPTIGLILTIARHYYRGKPLNYKKVLLVGTVYCVLVLISSFTRLKIERDINSAQVVNIGLVQGNIDLFKKRSSNFAYEVFNLHKQESEKLKNSDVIIWPETIISFWLDQSIQDITQTPFNPIIQNGQSFLIGSLTKRKRDEESYRQMIKGLGNGDHDKYLKRIFSFKRYNSVIGIDSEGLIRGTSSKSSLMPFGEYLPFADIYPSLYKLSPNTGIFSPGEDNKIIELEVNKQKVKFGILICYEDLLHGVSRRISEEGVDILVNFTNDAWYGRSHAASQHALLASARAIENGRYLVRATNTGLTSIISPFGQIEKEAAQHEIATLTHSVPILKRQTLFTKYGHCPLHIIAFLWITYCFAQIPVFKNSEKDV